MNIADVLDEAVASHGDRIAYGGEADGLTFAGLREAAEGVAARAIDLGAARVAVVGPNSPLVAATLFGAALAGATYVPVNHRLPEHVVEGLLARLEPVVVPDAQWLSHREQVRTPAGRRPAAIMFTSGSSAEPKAVVLEHEHLMAAALREPAASAAEGDALLLPVPAFHVPNVLVTLAAVYTGRRIVPFDATSFSASAWLDAVQREQITHTVVVPTMLHRIVQEMERTGRRVPSLKRLTYGSARMPAPVLDRALRLFPTTGFSNGYGSTESAGAVSLLSPDDHREALSSADPAVRARLRSVGRALPGVQIKVVARDGREAPVNETGEIHVRGAQISGQYLDHQSQLDHQGWMRTGDQGWLDGGGYLFCAGRGAGTIISGGENIAAAEIEDALIRHPAVAEAAVVGLDDDEWGEVVAAMVSLNPDVRATVGDLQGWVRERLGSLKTPRVIRFADALPRTGTGKILHRAVRELLTDNDRTAMR